MQKVQVPSPIRRPHPIRAAALRLKQGSDSGRYRRRQKLLCTCKRCKDATPGGQRATVLASDASLPRNPAPNARNEQTLARAADASVVARSGRSLASRDRPAGAPVSTQGRLAHRRARDRRGTTHRGAGDACLGREALPVAALRAHGHGDRRRHGRAGTRAELAPGRFTAGSSAQSRPWRIVGRRRIIGDDRSTQPAGGSV